MRAAEQLRPARRLGRLHPAAKLVEQPGELETLTQSFEHVSLAKPKLIAAHTT
jgi:hypothetical protein